VFNAHFVETHLEDCFAKKISVIFIQIPFYISFSAYMSAAPYTNKCLYCIFGLLA
jgi:hypothetical protein